MYFNGNREEFLAYTQAIDFLAAQNPKEIGLYGDLAMYSYPIWPLLEDRLGEMPRLAFVEVKDSAPSKLRKSVHAQPFVFSTIGPAPTLEGERYHVIWKSPSVTVLATAEAANEWLEGLKRIINPKNLLTRSNLEVYLDRNDKVGNRLVYVGERCFPRSSHPIPAEPRIFLHIIPADKDDLPHERKQYGFDNFDFNFNDGYSETYLGERCITIWTRTLPAYATAALYTGQYTDEGRLWEAKVSFNE